MNVDAVLRLAQSSSNYELGGNKLLNVEATPEAGLGPIVNLINAGTASVGGIITIGTGAPGASTTGLVYIRTDGTAEDTRLYLRGDPAANDWNAVLGGV